MLARLFSDRQTNVWMVLVAATVLTAVVGLEQHGGSAAIGLLLLGIAFIKIRLVALHFMEIREAPLPLRLLVEAYVGVTFVVLVVIYVVA
ncbi:cytochrome C oxidase subunit IV family protein [Nocardioides sp. WS12]|uniref:cytochrome C oxidase subunit IV family protein n=1 Tax=Nocardioides sp. WS12 TaxID=2486272 RepID=UPI001F2DA3B0|nr:cytochrome C oxidase subunit IV family protein [Nocardioides sp. WS12]